MAPLLRTGSHRRSLKRFWISPLGYTPGVFLYCVVPGCPAAAALQSATVNAAQVLGVDDQGAIEPGKRADIIALPGDPLADIGAVLGVDFVMKDGQVFRRPAATP